MIEYSLSEVNAGFDFNHAGTTTEDVSGGSSEAKLNGLYLLDQLECPSGDGAMMREGVAGRYEASLGVGEAYGNFSKALMKDTLTSDEGMELFNRVYGMIEHTRDMYLFPDQYHTAEHMINVVANTIELARVAGLPQDPHSIYVRSVAAAYHDVGNSRSPDPTPGADETDSVISFVRNYLAGAVPGNTVLHSQHLSELQPSDVMQIISSIGGTVFKDRHCSAARLETFAYTEDLADIVRNDLKEKISEEDIADFAALTGLSDVNGREDLEKVIAHGMLSKEAMVLKHADLGSSFEARYVFKNHITNRWEDRKKTEIADITSAADYFEGFVNFARGDFHKFSHADDLDSPVYREAQGTDNGNKAVFMCAGPELAARGEYMLEQSERFMELVVEKYDPLLTAMHELIRDGIEIPAKTLSELEVLLQDKGVDFKLPQTPEIELIKDNPENTFASLDTATLNYVFIPDTLATAMSLNIDTVL